MEKIEDRIKKELENKNIHNKNYFWIFSIVVFTIIIIIYSYQTDTGIIAKQTINKDAVVKNQKNLKQLYKENKPLENEVPKETLVLETLQEKIEDKPVIEEIPQQDETLVQKEVLVEENLESSLTQESQNSEQAIPSLKEETLIKTASIELPQKIEPPKSEELAVVPKENLIIVQKNEDDLIAKVIEPKTNFNVTSCYDFEPAKYTFVQSCQERLNNFIQDNSTATRYEIIGLIDLEDVKTLINKGEINQGLLAKNRILSVREFLQNKTNIPLSDHFYYLKSELQTKGFVLRAYF